MKFRQIARWEFVEKVRSKAFLISLVLLPLIMVVFGVLPGFLASKEDEKPLTVGIIDETGKLFDELNKRVDEKFKLKGGVSNYILKDLKKDGEGIDEERRQATQLLASDKLEGYFEIPASVFDSGKVVYRAQNVGNVRIQERFSRTIEEVIVEGRLRGQGLDPDKIKKLLASIDVKSVKVNGKGEEKESGFLETFFSAYIVIMMLFFLVMTSGQLLIRSVLEEKSNRVMEVLLSSCSARDLMVGKILGLSGLGILQMLIWGTISMGIALKTGSNFFSPDYLLLSVVYFVLGYLLYAAIFVTAGSPVTTEQEAQQITSYISLMLVFPIVLAVPVMQNPGSLFVRILTYIPLLTPTFMVLRMPIQMPATWEFLVTIPLLIVSVVVMMWVAGKVFRVAILSYGKRPSIRELVRWVRES